MEIKIFDVLGTIFIIYALLVTIEFLQNVVITILIFFFFSFFIVNCSLPGDFGFDPLGLGMPLSFII